MVNEFLERGIAAERSVLGSMLIEAEAIPRALSLLAAEDFYRDAHRDIFSSMQRLFERGEPIDLVTLSEELGRTGSLENAGGVAYLASLASGVPTTAHVTTYARTVRDTAKERRLRHLGTQAAQAFADGNTDEALDKLEEARRSAGEVGGGFLPNPISVRDAFNATPEALDFVLPGLLAGTVGMLVSTGGVGKSFTAISLAASVAAGLPFFGGAWAAPERTGGVLYVNAEDTDTVLRYRLHRLGQWLEEDTSLEIASANKTAIDLSLSVLSLYGKRPILIDKDGPRKDRWRDLAIAGNAHRLIIFDTLSRLHGLEERDNGDMARLMMEFESLADKTGASILLLHHVNKFSAMGTQDTEQHSARGASVLTDNGRWTATLRRPTAEEARKRGFEWDKIERRRHVVLSIPKANYADKEFADTLLRRTRYGFLVNQGEWIEDTDAPANSGGASAGSSRSVRATGRSPSGGGKARVPRGSLDTGESGEAWPKT